MATRADCDLRTALTVTRTVETGQTVALGRVVKDGNADHEVQHTTDGVDAIGVIVALDKLAGAAGDKVSVCLLAGAAVVKVKVGTGGATRGKKAKCVADGVTDAVISEATPTPVQTVGFFTQSGVAGDLVGMVPLAGYATE